MHLNLRRNASLGIAVGRVFCAGNNRKQAEGRVGEYFRGKTRRGEGVGLCTGVRKFGGTHEGRTSRK